MSETSPAENTNNKQQEPSDTDRKGKSADPIFWIFVLAIILVSGSNFGETLGEEHWGQTGAYLGAGIGAVVGYAIGFGVLALSGRRPGDWSFLVGLTVLCWVLFVYGAAKLGAHLIGGRRSWWLGLFAVASAVAWACDSWCRRKAT